VTVPAAPESAPATGLRALWRRRPGRCSPSLWATVIALDRLPWPLGEDALAGIYLVKSLGQRARWQRAREWAGAHRTTRVGRWWLAARLCACYGRFVARLMLVGFRDPEHFRAQVIVKGEERLKAAAGRGVILLGFHLGPPGAAIALRALGHQLTWARGWGDSQGGLRPAWRAFHAAGEMLSLSQDRHALGAVLYEARKILVEGGAVYITADGGKGREAFRVPTRPAPVVEIGRASCRERV